MQKVLILHHIEPMWEACFNAYELVKKCLTHINRSKYDKIILATFECSKQELYDYPEYIPLVEKIDELQNWSYAWGSDIDTAASDFGGSPDDYIYVSTPHETAYLYDWIKDLKGCQVSVAGGHRDECLQDLIETLEHLDIKYKKIEQCIYG